MKLTAPKRTLADIAAKANRIAGAARALPVLGGILLDSVDGRLRVTSSDLEATLILTTDLKVDAEPGERILVPGRKFADWLRVLPDGDVSVETDENNGAREIKVASLAHPGAPATRFQLLAEADYPNVPEPGDNGVEVSASELFGALGRVTPAASTDNARPLLAGVNISTDAQGATLVATDTYRLAAAKLEGTGQGLAGQAVTLPAKALGEVANLIGQGETILVSIEEGFASFTTDAGSVIIRLVEGAYPKWQSLVPQNPPVKVTVDGADLADALRRALVVAAYEAVTFEFGDGKVTITYSSKDFGEGSEQLDAVIEGDAVDGFSVSPRYFSDAVGGCGDGPVRIEVVDKASAVVVRPAEGRDYLHLVMPVRRS